jgi:hypothetical protein
MPARWLDLRIERGATFTRRLVWKDATGAPIPLDGFEIRSHFRRSLDASDTLLVSSLANERFRITGPGQLLWTLPASVTATLPATDRQLWVYDVEAQSPAGEVWRLLEGCIVVAPEVTR